MGLDMYLTRKKWIDSDTRAKSTIIVEGVDESKVKEITEEAMYWRKANAIHKWFVDNVQGGSDDCREYNVDREDLVKLLETVNKVLENNELAEELLPTQEGFFFGSTAYNEDYFGDLKYTKEGIEEVLKRDGGDFYYQSSW